MRRTVITTLACTSLLAASGCAGSPSTANNVGAAHLEAAGVEMVVPGGEADSVSLRRGARQLGHDLARSLPSDDGNLVYSPVSLALAFAMLREGAVGPTADEIDAVLRFPADRRTACNALITELSDVGRGDVLEVNDSLFVDPSLTVEGSYLEAIKRWYGAGVEQTEFPAPALDDINGWVDDKTHGRIPKLIDQLDPAAVFALVNTIYLKARWQHEFERDRSHDSDFTTPDGSTVSVPFMYQTSVLDHVAGDGWQAVRLAYAGGELSMWVLLPDGAKVDPRDLLEPAKLAEAASGFAATDVDLALPRWDTETAASLTSVLRELGMSRTFDDGDFSALTKNPAFQVTEVLQQANITVGEKGTEAAAATAIIGETSLPAPPPHLVTFTADHPFAFAIVHDASGVPLFEGVVADPS